MNKKETTTKKELPKGVDGTRPGIDREPVRENPIKSIPGMGRSSRALNSAMRGLFIFS